MKPIHWLATSLAALALTTSAFANDKIGSVSTSGWIFKDTINITAFDDPDVAGVTCYTSAVDNALTWDNASDSSIACRRVGPINATSLKSREEVFSQSQSPFFKYQRVDRFYDAKRNVLVYISYVRKNSGENHAHALSVVPLGQ